MLSALTSLFTRPTHPSAVIMIGTSHAFALAHLVPESGEPESFTATTSGPAPAPDDDDDEKPLRTYSAREVSRERIGSVTMRDSDAEGGGESVAWSRLKMVEDVSRRARELWKLAGIPCMGSDLSARPSDKDDADGTGKCSADDERDGIVRRIVDEALRPAALEAMEAMEAQLRAHVHSTAKTKTDCCRTETFPVFVVFVSRSEPGPIVGDSPRTIQHWC
ncbi:hypothetical protein ONZ51_g5206 [Trametes cubensis]|uniref:Uncharacterized protein n=1 Tax=Trametes cubensis TaxID=1111947 RepID=A0AAD7TWW1_9APHY|nr:hypothetical protein ONZ51_g5206 [Trametes cubensis]